MQPPRVRVEGEEVIVRQVQLKTSIFEGCEMSIDASMSPEVYQAIVDSIHRRETFSSGYERIPTPADEWGRIDEKKVGPPPPLAITYTDNQTNDPDRRPPFVDVDQVRSKVMPQGFGNAMRTTEKTREWVKKQRAERGQSFSGLGIGVNIRKVADRIASTPGEFELHISIFDQSRVFVCKDDFDVLERIQETMEEMFG